MFLAASPGTDVEPIWSTIALILWLENMCATRVPMRAAVEAHVGDHGDMMGAMSGGSR